MLFSPLCVTVAVAVAVRVHRRFCWCCCCWNRLVPPEYPLVLNRWGHQLNGTILGPMEEGDDIVLTCRVTGGKPRNSIPSTVLFFVLYLHTELPLQLIQFSAEFFFFIYFSYACSFVSYSLIEMCECVSAHFLCPLVGIRHCFSFGSSLNRIIEFILCALCSRLVNTLGLFHFGLCKASDSTCDQDFPLEPIEKRGKKNEKRTNSVIESRRDFRWNEIQN